jgi:TonB-dependent SusC/RagA subfamily outer membrane receptor
MRVLLLSLFFGLPILAPGQERVISDAGKLPYVLIDSFSTDLRFLVISPDKIESVNVLKDSNALAVYGDKARNGAVIIKTKPNTRLLRVNDIFDQYNIPKAARKLRVCINKTLINQPELILIEASEMLGAEITTEKYWIHPEEAKSTERLINIKTNKTGKKG